MIDVLDRDQLAALADIYDTLLTHHRAPDPGVEACIDHSGALPREPSPQPG
jgi:hypothetical protein